MKMRKETDTLGTLNVPKDALYGIHSMRACQNFPNNKQFNKAWYVAMGTVKSVFYLTYHDFFEAGKKKYSLSDLPFSFHPPEKMQALQKAANEIAEGKHFDHFIVPAIQGGAGTSINMNINEIIANVALKHLGEKPGEYGTIDPIEHSNLYQSTNDVVPTALRVAAMRHLNELEESINLLRNEVEQQETTNRDILRIAYTQMQEAVPGSFGKLFSMYSDALSRDWWRVSKCFERIKQCNLGGSAIGSGLTVPRFFIMELVPRLQRITGLPLTRSENMYDTTSNMDAWVEIHAILKAHAVNLEKMASDLRLLASDIHNNYALQLPPRQVGSSIMPGKVNPVISEYVISVAHQVYSNDSIIHSLAGQGCLELNTYLPSIGNAILDSLQLLISANKSMGQYMISGIHISRNISEDQLYHSPAVATALIPYIGYHKATEIAKKMQADKCDIFSAAKDTGEITNARLQRILIPGNLIKMGFSLKDIIDNNDKT